MLEFLPILFLLIGAIAGNLQIDVNDLVENLGDVNSDTLDNSIKNPLVSLPKEQRKEMLIAEKDEKENNLSHAASDKTRLKGNGESRSDMKMVSKRSETASARSWLYLPARDKVPAEESKTPKFDRWGGKSFPLYRSKPSTHHPIRVSFSSNRVKESLESNIDPRPKWSKPINNRNDQENFIDGYGVKRIPQNSRVGWKVPFNSWGGKRSEEVADNGEKESMLIMENDGEPNEDRVGNDANGEFYGGGNTENNINEKWTLNTEGKVRRGFDSWGGKRAGLDYHTLSRMSNEINDEYATDNEIHGNEWLIPSLNKKAEQIRITGFDPWRGKRNSKAYALRLADNYSDESAESAKGPKTFLPRVDKSNPGHYSSDFF